MTNAFIYFWICLTVVAALASLDKLNAEPKFRVQLGDELVPQSVCNSVPRNGSYQLAKVDFGIMNGDAMSNLGSNEGKSGMSYACFVPTISDEFYKNGNVEVETSVSDELLHSVVSKLQSLLDDRDECSVFLGVNSGYWTYGYCFGDKIIQFHENITHFYETGLHIPQEPAKVFVLGRFPGVSSKNEKIENVATEMTKTLKASDFTIMNDPINTKINQIKQQMAIRHTLKNGGICDITGAPRVVDVIYRCDPNVKPYAIINVEEIKTCEYEIIVNVKGLCQFEEFRPSPIDEKVFDISCGIVEDSLTSKQVEIVNALRNKHQFPFPRSLRVDLSELQLIPGGSGFFWGRPKHSEISSDIYDRRTILIHYTQEESSRVLISQVANMFSDSMVSKVLSPAPNSGAGMAKWSDTFTVWYELYDYHGNFETLVKISRDGNNPGHEVAIQLVDIFTLTDQDGDPVNIPTDVPVARKYWQYEHYSAANQDPKTKVLEPNDVPEEEYDTGLEEEFFVELAEKLGLEDPAEIKRAFEDLGVHV